MEHASRAPGFYGKLPSHGDFVGRRLPPGVRHCLDEWLQRALAQSRNELGPAWLAAWGNSPIWRFAIGAGVCGDEAWTGVMMPSADRVQRCFPLLLAAPVDGTPSLRDCLTRHGEWFEALEELALSALEEGFAMEAFDARLIALGDVRPARAPVANRPDLHAAVAIEARVSALDWATDAPAGAADTFFDRQSAWWTEGSPLISPVLAICASLPSATQFVAFLDGRWAARGWAQEQAKLDRGPP